MIKFDFKPHRFAPELYISKVFFDNGYGVKVTRLNGVYSLSCIIQDENAKDGYLIIPFNENEKSKQNIGLGECREIANNIKRLPLSPIKRKSLELKGKQLNSKELEKIKKKEEFNKQFVKADMYGLINSGNARKLSVRDVFSLKNDNQRIVVFSKAGKELLLDYFCIITVNDFKDKYSFYKNKTDKCFGYNNYLSYLRTFNSEDYINTLKDKRYIISNGELTDIYNIKGNKYLYCEETDNEVYYMLY